MATKKVGTSVHVVTPAPAKKMSVKLSAQDIKIFAAVFLGRRHAFSYEYIIVGSGSAGSVVASRLAEAGYHVLLLEAGSEAEPLVKCEHFSEHTHQFQTWQYPTQFHDKRTFINNPKEWRHVLVHAKFEHLGPNWNGTAFAEAYLWLQKQLPVVHKKFRRSDQRWLYPYPLTIACPAIKFRSGIYTEVILLKLIERGLFNVAAAGDAGDSVGAEELEAENGVVDHETREKRSKLTSASMKSRAMHLLDHSGYRRGWWLTTNENYDRRTSYDSLVSQKAYPNLDVWLNATVAKVLFDDGGISGGGSSSGAKEAPERSAIGVEVQAGPLGTNRLRVYASREVILSAGALGTPKILTLSGIADPYDLGRLGIGEVVAPSYAVGKYLKDHLCWVGYVMMHKHFGNRDDCDNGIMGSERLGIFLNITEKSEDEPLPGAHEDLHLPGDVTESAELRKRLADDEGGGKSGDNGNDRDHDGEPHGDQRRREAAERKRVMWENVIKYEADVDVARDGSLSGPDFTAPEIAEMHAVTKEKVEAYATAADQFAVEGELRLFSQCHDPGESSLSSALSGGGGGSPGTTGSGGATATPTSNAGGGGGTTASEVGEQEQEPTALHYTVEFVQMRPKTTGRVFVQSQRAEVPPVFEYPRIFDEDYEYMAKMGRWMGDQFASTGQAFTTREKMMAPSTGSKSSPRLLEYGTVGALSPVIAPEPITEQAFSPGALESARATARLYQHPCCSAGVGRVLTNELRVVGVKNLRVADASAWAEIPSSHLAAPTMALGFLAAKWIVADARAADSKNIKNAGVEGDIDIDLPALIAEITDRVLGGEETRELKQYMAVLFDGRLSVTDVRDEDQVNNGLRLREEILQRIANTMMLIFRTVVVRLKNEREQPDFDPQGVLERVRDVVLRKVFYAAFPADEETNEEDPRVGWHLERLRILLRARLRLEDDGRQIEIEYPPSCPVPVLDVINKFEKTTLEALAEAEEKVPDGIGSPLRELLEQATKVVDNDRSSVDHGPEHDAAEGADKKAAPPTGPLFSSDEESLLSSSSQRVQATSGDNDKVAVQNRLRVDVSVGEDDPNTVLEKISLHKIAFGTGTMDERYFQDTCVAFLRAGGRVLDTAHLYDNNEAIRDCIKHAQVPREDVVLITKVMPLGRRETEKALDAALAVLGTEENFLYKKFFPLDYVLVHWPGNNAERKLQIRVPADCAMIDADDVENEIIEETSAHYASKAGAGPPLMYGEEHYDPQKTSASTSASDVADPTGVTNLGRMSEAAARAYESAKGAESVLQQLQSRFAERAIAPDQWRRCREQTYETLIAYQKAGKIKKIGYSNFGIAHVNEFAVRYPEHPPQMHQMEVNPAFLDFPVVETHAVQNQYYESVGQPWNKCVLMAYGLIKGRINPFPEICLKECDTCRWSRNNRGQLNLKHVDQIAKRNEIDRWSMLVKWIVDHLNGIVLVASRSVERLKNALCLWKTYPGRLPLTDMSYLTQVANNYFKKAYRPYPDEIA
eukprot:g15857.t1